MYRAIHLELVTSLSTQDCLGGLRRFIGTRGRPDIIYSDNGLNFVGADNAFKRLNWDQIARYSAAKRIDWRFNPSTAAWWGGWWEQLIGLLKVLLRKVLGKACLTYEDMCTVLCDCELVVNSRPLTYLSEDPNDLKTLTPAMFLHEIRETEVPDLDIIDQIDLNSRFKRRQEIMDHLKNRFRKEYLGKLILPENSNEKRDIRIGDVVIIGEDIVKRIHWPLARVQDLLKGKDGVVRVVVLKAKEGIYKRPIQRIYPLEMVDKSAEEIVIARQKMPEKESDSKVNWLNVCKEVRKSDEKVNECKSVEHCAPLKTRSGRVIKKPNYFQS